MVSSGGRYIIAYNGEIYNHPALRRRLELEAGNRLSKWRGHSDTEIVLAAIEVWDCQKRALYLVRDRLGIKPLYYGWERGSFLFGSELKAIKAHPTFNSVICRDALTLLLRHNCIPAPYSIYQNIFKLLPGYFLHLSHEDIVKQREVKPQPYWRPKEVAEKGQRDIFNGDEIDAVSQLDFLLRDAVKLQMVSDVPLGTFLSGGVDSSTIVAMMQAQSSQPIKTFTIGFKDRSYNEAEQAKEVANHLGTDHTELYVTPEQTMAVIPKLATLYDEPFADASQIPTFLISEFARQYVTVSLSGDGGDELFGGYNRHFWVKNIWDKIRWIPGLLRSQMSQRLKSITSQRWDSIYSLVEPLLPMKFRTRLPGEKLHKLAEVLPANSIEAMYYGLTSHWKEPARVVLNAIEPPTILTDRNCCPDLSDFIHRMMYLDLITYLPDDILVKVDRASMGVSLETRVPLLDHRVVEFAWRLPLSMKVRNGQGKWLLRQVLYQYVPKELVERPKSGFGIPIDSWLRGPLRDWAESLLDERHLKNERFFDPALIRRKWTEHLSGKRNWQYHLWDILMFQAWKEHNNV
jgi:asparagine synthase (glutamine-hydrolysing)